MKGDRGVWQKCMQHGGQLHVSTKLRAARRDAGQATPDMDLLIAATALIHNLTLVTHNTQDYANIPGLRIQDWLNP